MVKQTTLTLVALGALLASTGVTAQLSGAGAPGPGDMRAGFVPVTDEMLRNPDPADWLMYSRTYDAQRFSPLDQIDRSNVASLTLSWSKALPAGVVEVIPIVYRGVMYTVAPPAEAGSSSAVLALDAANGEVLWSHVPEGSGASRLKALAIYDDMVYYTAPAANRGEPSPVVALDAVTGDVHWRTAVSRETHTAGAIVVDGTVLSGRTCNSARENCFIAAHDALTGEEVWRFHTAPDRGEPGDASWGGLAPNERRAATWGLPGTYDPVRDIVYWGISNPMPNTRLERHGSSDAIPAVAPADLYSNSTVALDPDTGALIWYYQHLPGDDWDMDINQEKTLIRSLIDPDPRHVKWINPDVPKGVARDVVITVGEGGGLWVNDRDTGQFLWAMPFPADTPHFILSDIDVNTGVTRINMENVLAEPGDRRTICYHNTRSFWPTAYHPGLNSLFVPYVNQCLDMTAAVPGGDGESRISVIRPDADQEKYAGIARIDMRSGEIHRFNEGRVGGNGAILVTAGDVVFWGDIMHVLHAFDAASGEVLWESEPLGAPIQTSTITYAVDGKQYVAVVNSNALIPPTRMGDIGGVTLPPHGGNSINVFALTD
ncbi:PQQ-binding-like beta-propeller repeat protein [Candidatus Rariloculus sp.]|uniref:outer membrane protein assembly factor BamB family protein n=1 Tax=Candidatus Rariloculus sp. TaxID=3101265 RepID=UPI003D0E6421